MIGARLDVGWLEGLWSAKRGSPRLPRLIVPATTVAWFGLLKLRPTTLSSIRTPADGVTRTGPAPFFE
jgi:hypothetical protein